MTDHRVRVRTPLQVYGAAHIDRASGLIVLHTRAMPPLKLAPDASTALGALLIQAAYDHGPVGPARVQVPPWLERDTGEGWQMIAMVKPDLRLSA